MKPIHFSNHARLQMAERGAEEDEVIEAIRTGEQAPAKRERQGYRKNFQYNRMWGEKTYCSVNLYVMDTRSVNLTPLIPLSAGGEGESERSEQGVRFNQRATIHQKQVD